MSLRLQFQKLQFYCRPMDWENLKTLNLTQVKKRVIENIISHGKEEKRLLILKRYPLLSKWMNWKQKTAKNLINLHHWRFLCREPHIKRMIQFRSDATWCTHRTMRTMKSIKILQRVSNWKIPFLRRRTVL